jgi:hypothetical protein
MSSRNLTHQQAAKKNHYKMHYFTFFLWRQGAWLVVYSTTSEKITCFIDLFSTFLYEDDIKFIEKNFVSYSHKKMRQTRCW